MLDIFDILGPVMVGPSSSHTAGAVRIGRMARTLLGAAPVRADIGLHGSFADTGQGHGTDRALVAGLNYGPFHFTSNHASNYLPLKGTLPDDREKFLQMIDDALGGKQRIRSEKYRAL